MKKLLFYIIVVVLIFSFFVDLTREEQTKSSHKYISYYTSQDGQTVIVPEEVHSLKDCTFSDYTGELVLNSNSLVENDYSSDYYGHRPSKTWLRGAKFSKLTIGDNINKIGRSAFYECSTLRKVVIGNNINTIGTNAFYYCTSLSDVIIPNGVAYIGDWAFAVCTSLESITLPETTVSIGFAAFYECQSLKEVYCRAKTPPTGSLYMFDYLADPYRPINCKIYVPASSVELYKTAEYWSKYKSQIIPYNFNN